MTAQGLTIREVAKRTGLGVHTLRYYERAGLLEPGFAATNGHRRYSRDDLAWIEFLTRLRATAMPIRHMQQFADLRRKGPTTVRERRCLLEAHQQAVQGASANSTHTISRRLPTKLANLYTDGGD